MIPAGSKEGRASWLADIASGWERGKVKMLVGTEKRRPGGAGWLHIYLYMETMADKRRMGWRRWRPERQQMGEKQATSTAVPRPMVDGTPWLRSR